MYLLLKHDNEGEEPADEGVDRGLGIEIHNVIQTTITHQLIIADKDSPILQ